MTSGPRCSAGATLAVAILAAAAILPGCLPEARIAWSPDGKYALLRGAARLYLCDADGKLTTVPPADANDVRAAAWMPDSRQFLAVCAVPMATWEELSSRLSQEDRTAAELRAEDFRKQVLAYKGEWKDFAFQAQPADIVAALMCLRDKHGKELAGVVGTAWEGLKPLAHHVYRVELLSVADGQVKHVRRVLEWPGPIAEIRVSPTGRAMAFAGHPYPPRSPHPEMSLYAAALAEPGTPVHVADQVSLFFDWTSDGLGLVFSMANRGEAGSGMPAIGLDSQERRLTYTRDRVRNREGQDRFRGGVIRRHVLFAEDGALLEKPDLTNLAHVFYFDSQPVRCLKDGRTLFAAVDACLPAPPAEVPAKPSLFRISRIEPVTITQVLSPTVQEQVGQWLDLMQLSPDGARICAVTDEAVTVVDLADGKITANHGDKKHLDWRSIPVWRTSEEVCFVVTPGAQLGSPGRAEIVLCSPTATRCLSKDWPAEVLKDILQRGR